MRRSTTVLWAAVVLFAALPASASIDVTGTWHLTSDFGGAFGYTDWTFTQTGTTVTATPIGPGPIPSQIQMPLAGPIVVSTGAFDWVATHPPPDVVFFCSDPDRLTGTIAPDGRSLTANAHVSGFAHGCLDSVVTGTCTDGPCGNSAVVCGNGVVEAGEECEPTTSTCCDPVTCQIRPAGASCDDGNDCTGPDTCSGLTCSGPLLSAGSSCDRDGTVCTLDTCNVAGVCLPGPPQTCGPCDTCDPIRGCVSQPAGAACPFVAPPRTRFTLRGERDRVVWHWRWTYTPTVFDDPTAGASYLFCAYTDTPVAFRTVASQLVPAGGVCGSKPCWKRTGRGFRFRRAAHNQAGVEAIDLTVNPSGVGEIRLKGGGAALGVPDDLSGAQTVVWVQLRSSGGKCSSGAFVPGVSTRFLVKPELIDVRTP